MLKLTTYRIRLADIAATPWKNGGGVTREIATGARPDGGTGWGWRISLAEVAQDGPFSLFPETDRVIAVIAGAGMDLLRPDGTAVALAPLQPVHFAGEEPFEGRLRDGPVRDLNVMVRRGLFAAEMEIRDGPCSFEARSGASGCLAILNLAGGCKAADESGTTHDLSPQEILLQTRQGHLVLEIAEGGRAAVISVARR